MGIALAQNSLSMSSEGEGGRRGTRERKASSQLDGFTVCKVRAAVVEGSGKNEGGRKSKSAKDDEEEYSNSLHKKKRGAAIVDDDDDDDEDDDNTAPKRKD